MNREKLFVLIMLFLEIVFAADYDDVGVQILTH
jgi:hypothetical protein